MNYYNDNDPFCCSWLKEQIKIGLIPDGVVDDRSIKDVKPKDLFGFTQHHFFAGAGGWIYGLRMAGWPDEKPVWTASCPCQPFSNAWKGKGVDDERHLWPAFRWLVAQYRPECIFGEQTPGKRGLAWLAGVHLDLEALGYTVGAADLPAACQGAPHVRQRLWWVADTNGQGLAHIKRRSGPAKQNGRQKPVSNLFRRGTQKWLPEPDVVRVVHGVSANPRGVHAYGNAIVPQVAAEFIKAFMSLLRLGHNERTP